MRPGAPPKSCGYVCTGPGEVSSLVTDPPGTPVTPRIRIYCILIWWINEVLRLYRRATHTPCLWQGGAMENEVKMRMKGGMKVRWTWKWDERLLNQNAKRGTQKKRERTHTPTHLARSGQTLKGQGKVKAEGRQTRNKTSGGGKTEAPEPTWHSENLHKPQHATDPTYLGREERMK